MVPLAGLKVGARPERNEPLALADQSRGPCASGASESVTRQLYAVTKGLMSWRIQFELAEPRLVTSRVRADGSQLHATATGRAIAAEKVTLPFWQESDCRVTFTELPGLSVP
jgi:hypothetical protein